ncbi:DUF3048 domain-containing protein [Eubacterium oxidoreducens]|uniref:DUF3048 domain-containing protein n=1 Tax=Eubacterium oxidoreducens TaxID=1732 RepID=A0A1G6AL88_EUBOX|nr:DUF3048 domain-containing protein [Eubacterium oxidoreducens]SDB09149.1 Protein of unknown function [Eubacterium oxidoreducens]
MKRVFSVILVAALCMVMFAACGKKEETVVSTTEDEVSVVEEEPVDTHEGQAKSYLTGEWIDEDTAALRPFAVMFGNTNESGVLPQAGIGSADVVYECTVEGGLTRLMGIFQDYESVEKYESIRSCRLYFLEFASEFEAIYGHWGQSPYAKSALSAYDDLDGQSSTIFGTTYFRDSSKSAPHNGYATGEGVAAGIEALGYDKTYSEDYEGHYQFAEDDQTIELSDGEDAVVVKPGYVVNKPWFSYDEEDGLYYRYQYSQSQTDATSGNQLAYKNIIFQYMTTGMMDSKTLNIPTNGSGKGKYITNGKAIDITWEKDTTSSVMHYYDESGNEITLNQGKTWVCVVDSAKTDAVGIYASKEDAGVE